MKFKDIRALLSSSIEYTNDSYTKTLIDAGVTSLIIYCIFVFLEPFRVSSEFNIFIIILPFCALYGLIYFINVAFLFPAFNSLFNIKKWFFYSFILSYLWVILSIAFSHHVLQNFLNNEPLVNTPILFRTLKNAFFVGLIPSALLGFWTYIQYLKKELNKNSKNLNKFLRDFPYADTIKPISTPSGTVLAIQPDDIIYMKSDDNYVIVFYSHNSQVKKELVRSTLKSISSNFQFPFLRVHRSYLVNFNKVHKVDGNNQALTLTLSEADAIIPVSKTYIPKVMESLTSH
ncbi:MAG: LytTR family DNA-binding domain-containing protein [Balneola sp.]